MKTDMEFRHFVAIIQSMSLEFLSGKMNSKDYLNELQIMSDKMNKLLEKDKEKVC